MVANTSPIFGLTPKTAAVTFVNADGTGLKTLYTAGANGARIVAVNATTDDTAANDVNLYVQIGGSGTARNIGGKRVPLASGSVVASTVASVNLLDSSQIPGAILPDGSIMLGPSDVLQCGVVAAVTAAKTLTIVAFGVDY